MKKNVAFLLIIVMLASYIPISIQTSQVYANTSDEEFNVFDALGIDDSVNPEGFNSDNNDNPYGVSTINIRPVSELLTADDSSKKLYGDDKTFLEDGDPYYSGQTVSESVYTGDMSHFNAISGDFTGNGLNSDIVVLGAGFKDTYEDITDGEGNVTGEELINSKINTYRLFFESTKNDTEPPNTKELKVDSASDFGLVSEEFKDDKNLIYNYLKMSAGDFTGDGIDEIAVFLPEQGSSRVMIYQLQIPNGETAETSWNDSNNWDVLFSYPINSNGLVPDKITLLASDLTGDGVDDLGVAWGMVNGNDKVKSNIQVLKGSKESSDRFDVINVEIDDLYRASIAIGDIDGDRKNEFVVVGDPAKYSNQYVHLAYYEYDDDNEEFIRRKNNNLVSFASNNPPGDFTTLLTTFNKEGMGQKEYIYIDGAVFELKDGSFRKNSGNRTTACYEIDSADLTGNGKEELLSKKAYYSSDDQTYKNITRIYKSDNLSTEYEVFSNQKYAAFCNTDQDTVQMKFIGKRVVYSDPKVLAVLASPPYFKDLEHLEGGDSYVGNSATTYGTSEGSSSSKTQSSTISAGTYVSFEQEFSFFGISLGSVQAEAEFSKSWTAETEKTSSRTQTIEYSTAGGQDTVALYSIPLVIYEYETNFPVVKNGEMSWQPQKSTITEPREATVRTYTLDAYDEIAKYYDVLPTIGGDILKHELGNPATYPTTTAGYRNVNQPDGPSIGVGYGSGGSITQTLELTEENSVGTSSSMSISTKVGAGAGGVTAGVTAGAESGSGTVKTNLNGKSFSTTIVGMPEEASEYGYDYNVKMFQYTKNHWGQSIPVVNYVVSELSMPPVVPTDFGMDGEGTSSNQVKLTWTDEANGDSVVGYQIFKQYDFPDGSADFPITFIEANEKDSNGVFSYVDTNLTPNTEYKYKIQVLTNENPDRSVKSDTLTVKTRPDVGSPEISLNGIENNVAIVYPDVEKTIKATVTNSETNVGTPVYQWQKYVSGQWRDQSGKTSDTLTFVDANLSVNGQYRLRVNQFVNENAVSVFSDVFSVEFLKRDVESQGIAVTDEGETIIVTLSSNSNTKPTGNVVFDITGEGFSKTVVQPIDEQVAIVENLELPKDGLYNINAYYSGNKIFNSINITTKYLKGNDTSYWLEVDDIEYGEEVSPLITEYKNEDGGQTSNIINGDSNYTIEYTYTNKADNTTGEAVNVGDYTVEVVVKLKPNEDLVATLTEEFSISQKPITITAPDLEKTESQAVTPELTALIVSPNLVNNDINDLGLEIVCLDNSGRIIPEFGTGEPNPLPGRYTIRAISKPSGEITDTERTKQSNYEITFEDGKFTVTGAKHLVTMIADESLENKSVGSIELISPEEVQGLEFQQNTSLTFRATPDPGYEVNKWFVNDVQVDPTEENKNIYKRDMPGEAIEVKVSFKVKDTNINFSAPNGTITCVEIPNLKTGDVVTKNATFTFNAVADEGYHFVKWQKIENNSTSYPVGTTNDNGNPQLAVTIGDSDVTVVPVFERDSYQLSLSDNLRAYYMVGNDEVNITNNVVVGDTEVIIVPTTGYGVSRDEEGDYQWNSNVVADIGSDGQSYTFIITENTIVEAILETVGLTGNIDITEESFGDSEIVLKIDGIETPYTLGEDFNLQSGSTITLEPKLSYGTKLKEYKYGDTTSTDEILTLTHVTESLEIAVTFEELDKYEIDFSKVDNRLHGNLDIEVIGQNVELDDNNILPVYKGDTVSITAEPDSGYMVGYWTIDNVRTSTNEKIKTIEDITKSYDVTCEFIPLVYYDLNFSAVDNGDVTVEKDNNYSVNTGADIGGGSKLEFTASPNNDYMVEKWVVNGKTILNEFKETYVDKVYTIDALSENTNVTVSFKDEVTHEVTVNEPVGATITGEFLPDDYQSTDTVRDGAAYLITATPDEDYRIETVTAVVYNETVSSSVYNQVTFDSVVKDINDPWICTINNVDGDLTVSSITAKLYDLVLGIFQGGTADITPSRAPNTSRAVKGEKVSVTATISDGYRFDKWIVEDEEGKTVSLNDENEESTTFSMPGEDATVTPSILKLYEISKGTFQGGTVEIAPTVEPNGDKAVEGEEVSLTITISDGYRFEKWVVEDEEGKTVSLNDENEESTTFIMPDKDVTVTPTIVKLYDVKLEANKRGTANITPSIAAEGDTISITATASDGYRFEKWIVLNESSNTITFENQNKKSTTFIMPNEEVTVIPIFSSIGGSGGSSGSGGGASVEQPPVDKSPIEKAIEEGKKNAEGKTVGRVEVKDANEEGSYEQEIPNNFFGKGDKILEVATPVGSVALPDDMFDELHGEDVQLSIQHADINALNLSQEAKEQIGNKPIIDINILIGGSKTKWESEDKEISVAIPYTLSDEEKREPHKVIAVYIDDNGNITPLTVSDYDFAKGAIVFKTKHTSHYSVQYVDKSFDDIGNYTWAEKAIEALAARGVINGVSKTEFAPQNNITRADFVVLITRFLGLKNSGYTNFADVETSTYYYNAVATAKDLGIITGSGENIFNPLEPITRQDMMVIIERALKTAKVTGKLTTDTGKSLNSFTDMENISDYATNSVDYLIKKGIVSGDGMNINPRSNTKRAEVAALLYKLLEQFNK